MALAVGVTAGVLLVSGGGDSVDPLEPRSIVVEPMGQQSPDPFVDENLDLGGADVTNLGDPPQLEEEISAGLSGATASGGTPGLYGGSQDAEVCDVERLVAFLTDPANADKAEAWAATQGIAVGQLAGYLEGLAPVRLRFDTRVTNHSFVEGEARPFQSVLQAGTAVLVDDRGVPRSKCFCGNPLTPPSTTEGEVDPGEALDVDELARNPEDAWEGFDPAAVVTVQLSPEPLDAIVAVDPASGENVEIAVTAVTAGGAEQAGSGYTIEELEAALPTDEELAQFPFITPCQDLETCLPEQAVDGINIHAQTTSTPEQDPLYLNFTMSIYPDPAAARDALEESQLDRATPVPYELEGWEGIKYASEPGESPCSAMVLVAKDNAFVEVESSASASGCAADQTVEQIARVMIQRMP